MYLKEKKIKIIPWTVNSYSDIANVLKFDIDGIISDYPDRVIKLKKLEWESMMFLVWGML